MPQSPEDVQSQVEGVSFKLKGRVAAAERERVKSLVTDFVRQNYSDICSRLLKSSSITKYCLQLAIDKSTGAIRLLPKPTQVEDSQMQSVDIIRFDPDSQLQLPDADAASFSGAVQYLLRKDQGLENSRMAVGDINCWLHRPLISAVPQRLTSMSPATARTCAQQQQLEQRMQQEERKQQGQPNRKTRAFIGDSYDIEEKGEAFQRLFPSVKGEFFIFYEHGESHCRKMLTAMGFVEKKEDGERSQYRPLDRMAVFWCNGTIASQKRKKDLGFYVVNRVSYRGLITNKCSLMRLLQEFEASHPRLVPPGLEARSFLPETLHVNAANCFDIFELLRAHSLFLLKPGHADSGKGIVIFRSDGTISTFLDCLEENYPNYRQRDLVLQSYIENPLLLNGKKFDLRVFLLVVPNQRRAGVYAFCHPGYVRLACRDYDAGSDNPLLHLTNQAMQCRDTLYSAVKEETIWTPQQFSDHLNERHSELEVPCRNWVRRRLYPRVRAVLAHVVSIASSSMAKHPIAYEMFGCDFLVDDKFNIWLLEINSDPCLNKGTTNLQRIITQATEEAVALSVEVLQRAERRMPVKNFATQQDFRKIYSHGNDSIIRRIFAEAGVQPPDVCSHGCQ